MVVPRKGVALGRLTRVELRDAWSSESSDFTPWLAQPDNIALLGEAIGVELEVVSQEMGIGPFHADILCRDTISNHFVLIENQLERTDHSHLGQLLTYAAGLEAVTIIWIAARFTEEHRAALDWLNNVTKSDINFFGLEIELWRIGDSPMAPKFNVVSKPNDWSKTIRDNTSGVGTPGELSEFQRLHLQFWTQFRQYLEDHGSPIRTTKPSPYSWSDVAVGRSNFTLSPWNGMRDNRSGITLWLMGPDAKTHFRLLGQRYRDKINATLTQFGAVEWELLPDAKFSRITVVRPTTPSNTATWPELNKWMANALTTMHELFSPIVKKLNAAEYVPSDTDNQEAAPGSADGPKDDNV